MSELMLHLTTQRRLHKKCGANALSNLFNSAAERIAELEKERDDLLERTQREVFAFDFKTHNLEQQAIGIISTANKMNDIYVNDHNLRSVPPAQFAWWTRCFGYMKEQAEALKADKL